VRGENGGTSGQDTSLMNLNWATLKIHTPAATVPTKPSEFIADLITASSFKVQWTVPLDDGGSRINDFKIETSRDGGQTWTLTKTGVSTSTSLSVSGAAPGTTYLVRIAAVNGVGQSEYLTGSVTTLATIPSSPKNLISSNLGTNSASLGWGLPDSNGGSSITDYKVEVTSNGSNSWIEIPHAASNQLGFSVSNLLPGRTYQFRVSTITAVGVSASSNVLTITTLGGASPDAPASLSASLVKTTTANLSWPSVVVTQKVSNYVVDLSTDGNTWVPVSKRVSTSTSLGLSRLRLGTTYQVRVAAVNAAGVGAYVYGSFTTLATVATAPTSLTASNLSDSGFSIGWNTPTSNGGSEITDYFVEIKGGGFSWAPVAHPQSNNTSLSIAGLNPGVKYAVRVKAINSVGASKFSSTLSVTTLAVLPSSPVVLLKSKTATSVRLGWVAPANGGASISDYLVEYSTDGGTTWLTVPKSASTINSLTLKNLKTKTSYLFRVSAKNSVGYSAPSSSLIVVMS
jgi:titin